MIALIGLGNPDKKYQKSPHNIGFMVLNKLREKQNLPDWKMKKDFQALVTEGRYKGQKIILAKPQNFINRSGYTTRKIKDYYDIKIDNIWVIQDELDLPLGEIKIVQGRGAGGHKGIKSVINHLNSNDFIRLRVGISEKPQEERSTDPNEVSQYVLNSLNNRTEVITKGYKALLFSLDEGPKEAMDKYN